MGAVPIAIRGIRGGRMTWQPSQTEKGKTEILGRCVVTKRLHTVLVDTTDLVDFEPDSKQDIRQQFPSIADDLGSVEFLISGCSPAGWTRLFGDDDGKD